MSNRLGRRAAAITATVAISAGGVYLVKNYEAPESFFDGESSSESAGQYPNESEQAEMQARARQLVDKAMGEITEHYKATSEIHNWPGVCVAWEENGTLNALRHPGVYIYESDTERLILYYGGSNQLSGEYGLSDGPYSYTRLDNKNKGVTNKIYVASSDEVPLPPIDIPTATMSYQGTTVLRPIMVEAPIAMFWTFPGKTFDDAKTICDTMGSTHLIEAYSDPIF